MVFYKILEQYMNNSVWYSYLIFFQYINCGVNNIDNRIKCQQASFPINSDVLDIPQFTDNQHKFLIKNLSRGNFFYYLTFIFNFIK